MGMLKDIRRSEKLPFQPNREKGFYFVLESESSVVSGKDFSRPEDIHRFEKLPFQPNREKGEFLVKVVRWVEKWQRVPLQSKQRATWF